MDHMMRDERKLLRDITEYLVHSRLQRERRHNDWDDNRIARDVAQDVVAELERQHVQVVSLYATWRPLHE
jgi:hypothetical protein